VATVNRVLHGDLVKVEQAGANPKWRIEDEYDNRAAHIGRGFGRGGWVGNPPFEIPYVQAYATKDADKRGLIIMNIHLEDTIPVRINLAGAGTPAGVKRWQMTGESVFSDNENADALGVTVTQDEPQFKSGTVVELPPHSLTVLQWTIR
jgi:alpha-L-arabinofuranosidase